MLTDPQDWLVNTVSKVMARISSATTKNGVLTTYANSDKTFSLKVKHNEIKVAGKNRVHHFLVFTQRKVVTNPLDSTNDWDEATVSLMIDRPDVGWSSTEIDHLWASMKNEVDTAYLTKIYGLEN